MPGCASVAENREYTYQERHHGHHRRSRRYSAKTSPRHWNDFFLAGRSTKETVSGFSRQLPDRPRCLSWHGERLCHRLHALIQAGHRWHIAAPLRAVVEQSLIYHLYVWRQRLCLGCGIEQVIEGIKLIEVVVWHLLPPFCCVRARCWDEWEKL